MFNQIEYAYVEHTLSADSNIKMGRFFVPLGSLENDHAQIDQYFYSLSHYFLPVIYGTGVDVRTLLGHQTFAFQLVNSPFRDIRTTATTSNFVWYGSWLDGILEPLLSYGTTEVYEVLVNKTSFPIRHGGFGLKWKTVSMILEVEQDRVVYPKKQSLRLREGSPFFTPNWNKNEIIGTLIQLRYRDYETWNWIVKYTDDVLRNHGAVSFRYFQTLTGFEFFPPQLPHYRFHWVVFRENSALRSSEPLAEMNVGLSLQFQ
jgi:hypothetical protein